MHWNFIRHIQPIVTEAMNNVLLADIIETEIKIAVFQMNALGAPDSDGFSTFFFFKKNWDLVRNDVCKFVIEAFQSRLSLERVNHTFLTLIPKVKNAKKLGEFKPISFCNVIYQILVKTLANRLKHFFPGIIFPQQCAFVLGCLIANNVLISYEVLHSLATKFKDREIYMALKLDMSKVYDKIEWSFLTAVMSKLNFHQNWIKIIINRLSSFTNTVLVNGSPQPSFQPSRGVR